MTVRPGARMPDLTLSVVDRGFDDVIFELRRKLGEVFGQGFAKWVTERDRGQFLVIELPEANVECAFADAFVNAADERELIETVARRVTARVLAASRAGEPLTISVSCITEAPLKEKLTRVCEEITSLAQGKELRG
jgi:hypothetical protein